MKELAKAWFSFAEIPDPGNHRAYNQWHQLDHRPENLALDGVIYGERWVLPPDCAAAAATMATPLGSFHYLNMYWLSEPEDRSARDWTELGSVSFQWGRRDDLLLAERPLMGFFTPIKGYVNPRILISLKALPFRPTRGLYLTVSQIPEPGSLETHDLYRWYDQVRIPDLLSCRGAAGAWTFVSQGVTSGVGRYDLVREPDRTAYRLHLLYLDQDPLEFVEDLMRREPQWQAAGRTRDTSGVEKPIFAGPLRTIIPWQWDWFDA